MDFVYKFVVVEGLAWPGLAYCGLPTLKLPICNIDMGQSCQLEILASGFRADAHSHGAEGSCGRFVFFLPWGDGIRGEPEFAGAGWGGGGATSPQ